MNVTHIGIPWYAEEDYPAILAIMADAQLLPPNFQTWHKRAQDLRDQLRADGKTVIEAKIDPDIFPGWCRARGLNIDAKGRNHFAAEFAMLLRQNSKGHGQPPT